MEPDETQSSNSDGTGADESESSQDENKPFHVVLKGGAPWGFSLRGGSEVRSPLQIAEVS